MSDSVVGLAAPTTDRSRVRRRGGAWGRRLRRLAVLTVGVGLPVGVVGAILPWGFLKNLFTGPVETEGTYEVQPLTLNITLKEDGELKPVNSVELKNEVEGQRVTIEWVVPESTAVKKGDVLVRLASDDMKDRVEMEQLELQRATAALEEAEQQLAITQSENASRIRKAEIDLEVARLELKRYLEGDYEKSVASIDIDIKKTKLDIKRKRDELEKSRPLREKGFVTASKIEELEDELERLEMTLARNELELRILNEYELKKNKMQKVSTVEQAEEELEREKQRAASREQQARVKANDQRQSLALREKRFERLKEQLAKCELVAPSDGVVRYGESGERRYWSNNRIAAGEQVYPGQVLITLPDTSQMMVSTRIHEADRHKVREGMTCIVKVPAVPGRTFVGKLTKIAQFADSERGWLNPNLKEHAAEILLDETDAAVSPGDTAHIEILIEEAKDVLAVPVQCVFSRGAQHFVFVRGALSTAPVEVKLGRLTPTMVEVTQGVSAGDEILMAPSERQLAMLPTPATAKTGLPEASAGTPRAPAAGAASGHQG